MGRGGMAGYTRARLTIDRIERLEPGQVIMDTDEPALGVRRQGRARVYFVRKHKAGRRHYMTIGEHGAGGLTVTLAREKAKRVVAAINDGFSPAEARAHDRGIPTVSRLADEWLRLHVDVKLKPKTGRAYRSTLNVIILPALGSMRVDLVTSDLVQRMHHAARHKPYAANRAMAVLSKMHAFAERCGYVRSNTNPVRGTERFRETNRERFLNTEELSRLGMALVDPAIAARHSPFALAAIRLLLLTGARLNEALSLQWKHINLDRGTALLPDSKTGRKPIIFGEAAVRLLSELPRTSSPFVFPGAKDGQPLESVRKTWASVCRKADLDGVRIHDLRHTFASISASSGGSLPMIGRLLGHSQPQTTARYAHIAFDPVRELADRAARSIDLALGNGPSTKCGDN